MRPEGVSVFVQRWLLGAFGFAVAAAVVFLGLFFYSVSRPGLWLVLALGVSYYAILALAPRVFPATRLGMSLAFTSGACALWLSSSSGLTSAHWHRLFQLVTPMLAIPLAIGIGIVYKSIVEQPTAERPRLLPIAILTAVGWIISYASSSHGGASPMVEWLMNVTGLNRATADSIVVSARKTTHFCFYAFVAYVGMRLSIRNGASLKVALAAGFLAAITFATFDETRQSSEPDRGGSPWDVLLDMSGASAAMALMYVLSRRSDADRPMVPENSSTL